VRFAAGFSADGATALRAQVFAILGPSWSITANLQVLLGRMIGSPSMTRVTQANDDALKAGHDEHR